MNKRIGLVLNSSGAKGAYEVGVVKALTDAGITFDLIAGSSVGALNASLIAAGQIDELISIWEERVSLEAVFQPDGSGIFFKPLRLKSLGSNSHLNDLIKKSLSFQKLKESHIRLVIMATNLQAGSSQAFVKREDGKLFVETKDGVKEIGDKNIEKVLHQALLASTALPVAFSPVEIAGQQYVDGAVANNTPLLTAIKADCKEIFTVLFSPEQPTPLDSPYKNLGELGARVAEIALNNWLEQDFQKARMINNVIESWQGLSEKIISALGNTKDNSLVEHIQKIMNESCPFATKTKVLVNIYGIRPRKDLELRLFDFDSLRLKKVVRKGYQDGCKKVEELAEQGKIEGLGGRRIECAVCEDKYATGCEGKKVDRKFFDTIDRFIGKEIYHE